ncbi:MAG: hypothetical protein A3F31_01150 [Candidatus Levybacteria bacterium RIFCSPHIGHO2_12_FULL_38_12]|nr:MAG: hypothetical protein A2770_01780 [Candidatus Levybacteria bacterium RIFCSPHIGHO2_01_FULL_38_12]OGH22026.1 MAG: hypothetical protein A3D75_03310 [Candidatus Levybacteria bacterium RIFCSPHIGHO2_02_FULL_37_18]OGH23256.1 MAG: hypothetical protein A3F31_01150 [Candidatus Levybacteria bacterium RIFCSPHIGHO2_12_FULL_38_12]OGH33719.1 MAG: hypothetical protein A3A47_02745 [Candidatus Levybacteria bacterium RIFCSPLOWO2_01_FULL_37_20]OGH44625.1 MAG: hypothetical protein A3J14_00830 [Candidatus Lev
MNNTKIKKNNSLFPVKNKYLEFLPKIKEEKIQVATTVGLTFLGIILFGLFAISPTLTTIAHLRKSLADNQDLFAKLQEKNKNLSILQQKYSTVEKDIPTILSALPQKPSAPVFLGQIQTLLVSNHLNLINIGSLEVELTKSEEGENQYSSFIFNLSADGSNENVLTFINSLIHVSRIASIDNISLVENSKKGNTQVTITGKTYFKK